MNTDINYWISQYSYFGFFLFGLLNFVIPSEPILTFAGFQIQQGRLNYFLVLISALVGSFIKTSVIFGFGYIFGKQFLIKHARWTGFREEYLDFVKYRINHYGYRILTPLQFVPVVRRFLGAPGGLLRLNFVKFMIYNMLGVALWFTFLISTGFFFGKGYGKLPAQFQGYLNYLVWGIGAVFLAIIIYEIIAHFKKR
ncbi:MAG: DedA family protein [candidate division SR1 bacterium]|nr:DedA family protein [candidate division SR1 bacterium]